MKIKNTNPMAITIINLIKNNKSDLFSKVSTKGKTILEEFNTLESNKYSNSGDSLVASINNGRENFIPPNVKIWGFKKVLKVSKNIVEQAKLVNFESIIENLNISDLMIEPFIVILENDKEGFISYSREGDDITYLRWKNIQYYLNDNYLEEERPVLYTDCFSFATRSFFNEEIVDDNFAFKLLVYLFYGDVSEKFIPSNEKKKIGSLTFFTNNSPLNITYVNSLWKTNISTGGFSVRGHFRLQPYGLGRTEKRLIWIEEFTKKGYHRKAAIQNFNSNIKS